MWRTILFVSCAIVAFAFADYWLYPVYASAGVGEYDKGRNGLWLRYTWYFGEKSPLDFEALHKRLKDQRIKDAFFHVRFAEKSGKLHFRYPEKAKKLTDEIRSKSFSVRAIAWIYVGNERGIGSVDLSKPEVRKKLVSEAKWLIDVCGFHGVQWDYEICADGDKGFLSLLDETNATLGEDAFVSVAAPIWMPQPFTGFAWSKDYFAEVAKRCDQIAIMAYDTGVYLPRAYVWLVGKQVTETAPAIKKANANCNVLIGIRTYGEGPISHNPHSENIKLALIGVRKGLSSSKAARDAVDGVALFADYTTDDDEWSAYQSLWRNR